MTEAEFLEKVREKYGSRGVRQAKDFIKNEIAEILSNEDESCADGIREVMFVAWLEAKKLACEKYTPLKYRK